MARVARRLDLGDLKPAKKRDDGTIRAQAYLTRCGVFKYMQPDGTVRRELRLPEDVFDPSSLDSLSGVPVTNDHPPEMVSRDNAKKYAVGALQGMPKRHDDHMLGDLAIYDGDTIDEMKGRGKVQVSLGYTCDLDETPGHHPVYGDYDARQVNIRGNHCAIVDVARAGQTARVRLDAAQIVLDFDDSEARGNDGKWTGGGESHLSLGDVKKAATEMEAKEKALRESNGKQAAEFAKRTEDPKAAAKAAAGTAAADAFIAKHADLLKKNKGRVVGAAYDELASKYGAEKANDVARGIESRYHQTNFKQPTFAKAKEGHLANLKKMGWDVKTHGPQGALKTPHATSPDGGTRMWFKPQAVHVTAPKAGGKHDFGDARSVHHPFTGAPDIRSTSTEDLAKHATRVGESMRRLDTADCACGLASCKKCANLPNMADNATRTDEETPEQGGTPKSGTPDPQDLASRSAEGATDAKPGKKKRKAAVTTGPEGKTDSGDDEDDLDDDEDDLDDDEGDEDDQDDDDKASAKSKKRKDDSMTDEEKKALIKDRDSAIVRADAAEKALAKAEGELLSAKKDLEASKATTEKMRTDAADKFDAAVDAKVTLLTEAKATGAKVDAKMSAIEIKRTVVKHVDSIEVPAEKPEPYVDALYEGALRRARTDAADTKAGADALAAARKVAAGDQAPALKNDAADLFDEVTAARKARARSAEAYMQPWAPKKESK